MIVPMKKVFLVVQENGLKDTLKKTSKVRTCSFGAARRRK